MIDNPASAPAQPAPSDSPATQTALDAALASGDQGAYNAAKRAERAGKPLPDVTPAPTEPDPALAPEAKPVSKRQQQINDYERRIAEQNERIARLEGQLSGRADPAAPAPPAKKDPDWKRYAAMPDAPKLADFDSVEEHTAAMAFFINQKMLAERDSSAREQAGRDANDRDLRARAQSFTDNLKADIEAMAAVPKRETYASDEAHAEAMQDFKERTFPLQVLSTRPMPCALSRCPIDPTRGPINPVTNQPVTFADVVATVAFRSKHPATLLAYLRAHENEAGEIASLMANVNTYYDAETEVIRLDGRLSGTAPAPAREAAPAPKTLTDAPAPPVTLGSRPAEPSDPIVAALHSGDQAAYNAAKMRERTAAMGR